MDYTEDEPKHAEMSTEKLSRGEGPIVELRFLIPTKAAGVIIGKGGENINHLREEYSVKVNIPDSNGPERVLIMDGPLGSLMDILEYILPLMESSVFSRSGDHEEGNVDLRIIVHQSQAGCVIGKAGYKIKEFREQSGLRVLRVYQMQCPHSTDRIIQLVGDMNDALPCLQTIVQFLSNSPPKGVRQDYDARHFDVSQAQSYGGWGSGGGNMQMRGGGGGGGMGGMGMGGMGGGPHHGGNPGLMGGGHRGQALLGGPRGDMQSMVPMMRGGGGMQGMPQGNRSGMMGGGGPPMGGGFGAGPGMGGETTSTQVSIPDNLIGSIMGKAGTRIKQIREESGADIKINKAESGMEDRIITITGSQDQIQNAQYLLQMCVKKYSGFYNN